MGSQSTLPTAAEEGFKNATAYDTHRPSYEPAVVEAFLQKLNIAGKHGANVVEIGSGTGKFTELLAARPEKYSVKAVEPHGPMRDQLVQKGLRGVEVLNGKADEMPVDGEWGDVCIAAQAFHWFATPDTLKEIHRVLRPGAVLGMIWNVEDYNKPRNWPATTAWEQKLNDFILSLDDGLPRFRHQKWQAVFENQQAASGTLGENLPGFSLPLGDNTIKRTTWLKEEALWARLNTLSHLAVLKGEEKEAAVGAFKEIIQGNDVERNEHGDIAIHGVTYFAWTARV